MFLDNDGYQNLNGQYDADHHSQGRNAAACGVIHVSVGATAHEQHRANLQNKGFHDIPFHINSNIQKVAMAAGQARQTGHCHYCSEIRLVAV